MRNWKKLFTWAVCLVLACSMGLSAYASGGAPVTITLWHTLEEMYREDFQKLVDQFMADHPDIKVEVEYQGRVAEILQKVLAANVAGSDVLPAVFPVHSAEIKNLARDGVVRNLDSQIAEYGTDLEGMLMRDVYALDGSQYGLTWTLTGISFFYNDTIMQEEGLTFPKTWDEMDGFLRSATLKNEDGSTKRYGMWLPGWDAYYFTWMFWNHGIITINEDGVTEVNSEKAVAMVQQLKGWIDDGLIMWGYGSNGSSNMRSAFWDGGAVAIAHTSSQYQNHFDNMAERGLALGVSMPPAGEAANTTEVFGMSLCIPSKLDDSLVPAAYQLLAYLTSAKVDSEMAFFTGFLANNANAMATPEGQAWLEKNPAMHGMYDYISDMTTAVQITPYNAITDVMEDGLALIFLEGEDVQAGLDNMAHEISVLFEDQD